MNRLVLIIVLGLACSSRPMRLLVPDGASSDAPRADTSSTSGIVPSVSVSPSDEACALLPNGTITCWGNDYYPAPVGTFIALSAGSGYACAVRTDGTLFCWGGDTFGETSPPPGTFTSVRTGWDFACGIRTDGTLACWGNGAHGDTAPPAGTFTSISLASQHGGYDCGVRTDGTLACWGDRAKGETRLPEGRFTYVTVGSGSCPCGIRTDGTRACCEATSGGPAMITQCSAPPPTGPFVMLSGDYLLKSDGTVASWCPDPQFVPPSGTYVSISAGSTMACAIAADGTSACWTIR